MKNDKFDGRHIELNDPILDGAAVAPSDGDDLLVSSRALYIGGDGDLAVELVSGNSVTLAGVKGGTLIPIRATKVLSSGTTATGIVALW